MMNHSDGQRLTQAPTESERIIPGENPFTIEITDARHWLKVYAELHAFTLGTLELFRAEMADFGEPSHDDLQIYERQAQRFARQLAFWNQRLSELQARSGH